MVREEFGAIRESAMIAEEEDRRKIEQSEAFDKSAVTRETHQLSKISQTRAEIAAFERVRQPSKVRDVHGNLLL